MAPIPLPPDFSAFLRLLNEHEVRYLLIGGYAVGYHGYVRATADMDIWVPRERANSEHLVLALKEFGFDVPELTPDVSLRRIAFFVWAIPRCGSKSVRQSTE